MIHEDRNVATAPFKLRPTIRRIVRKIESLLKKIINAEAAISFNKIRLLEDILPNYTNINICIDLELVNCFLVIFILANFLFLFG
jgi:hypothetical protein